MSPRSRRALLMLSAALSAFVLVLFGAAASSAWRSPPASSARAPATIPLARQVEPRRAVHERREHEHEHDRERSRAVRHERHEHDEDDDG